MAADEAPIGVVEELAVALVDCTPVNPPPPRVPLPEAPPDPIAISRDAMLTQTGAGPPPEDR